MARSWKQERTTPKQPRKATPRPRVSEFAKQYYTDKGYTVDTAGNASESLCDTVTGDARAYLEADA
jgi:hypothetical protein